MGKMTEKTAGAARKTCMTRYNHERAHNRGYEQGVLVTKDVRIEYNYPYCVVLTVIMSAVSGKDTVRNRDKNKKRSENEKS